MTYAIPLMRHALLHERATLTALMDWLDSRPAQLSMGPLVSEFERQFAAWQGRRYAVFVNSGASANLVLLQALQHMGLLARGDVIAHSALTWATNVMPITQLGMRVTSVDVSPITLNSMLGDCMNAAVNGPAPGIRAFFLTNALGYLGDLDMIADWCQRRKITLIEDNCESLGSVLANGTKAGNFGLASTFSFFVAHHMSTIEGGMICTDDPALAELCVMVRANGWSRNLPQAARERWRYNNDIHGDFEDSYTFYLDGYNVRPTEITAFLGIQQLKYLDENLRLRSEIYSTLEETMRANVDFVTLDHSHLQSLAPFAFPIICHTPVLRERYIRRFQEAGIEIRPIIAGNITRQPFYKRHLRPDAQPMMGADFVADRGFYCGVYPTLSSQDIEVIKSCLIGV